MNTSHSIRRLTAVFVSLGVLLILIFITKSDTAHASFCSSHGDALQDADVIFSGTVLDIKQDQTQNQQVDLVHIAVSNQWKGTVDPQALVHAGEGRDCGIGNCGYKFKIGEKYLVFAFGDTSTGLWTDRCSRTSLLSQAQQDLTSLGPGLLPATGSTSGGLDSNVFRYSALAFTLIIAGIGFRSLISFKRIRGMH